MGVSLGMVMVGVMILIGAVGFGLALAFKQASAQRAPHQNDLDARARRLLQVFQEEEAKVKKLLTTYPEHPVVSGLAPDLLAEIEAMKEGSVKLVERSSHLRLASVAQGRLKHQVQQLSARAGQARASERESIEASLRAKEQELTMAENAGEQSRALDAKVEQAASELSLMRARLEQSALSSSFESDGDDLRASLNRLQSLWSSAEEAQELINTQP